MAQKILITGISGFVGSHLADLLVQDTNSQLYGTYINPSLDNISSIKNSIDLTSVDLTSRESVERLIQKIRPDIIYHLAAFTAPGESFDHPLETIINNVTAQLNILESIRKLELKKTKILITSSSDIYGIVRQEDLPIDEETPLNPTNPYSVSKLTQDFLALQYYNSYNLHIIRVRPFNHIGERQSPNFAVPTFAKKIAEIEKDKMPPVLKVGNLDAKRDFTNVRDMVRAYQALIEKGEAGEVYNIGSGKSHSMKEIVDMLLSFSTKKIVIETDTSLLRPIDIPELVCDNTKIHAVTGWKPHLSLEDTLKEVLDYWRNIV